MRRIASVLAISSLPFVGWFSAGMGVIAANPHIVTREDYAGLAFAGCVGVVLMCSAIALEVIRR